MGTLVQLSDGKFKQVRDGELECLMTGHDYVLVEKSLVSLIESLSVKGIEFIPAKIWGKETGTDNEDYLQMLVSKEFGADEIDSLSLDSKQFYLMDRKYLFATPSLVEKLKKSEFELEFSLGLSDFG
ncbi:hypothetical protein [Alkalimarinus coralli]|uniref:hypothetical protein n=1 Tax=Alkalimarinus coralli TaxID=2935863 RepID=UPI00202BA4A6|nr:hypothetical protein [Alkalimarinus coralli]